ncbi:MAG: hypothetical protein V1874_13135 [Spirochaetota bacterium]
MKTVNQNNTDNFIEFLKDIPDSDFDGHTEFERLSPEQRLMWLSQCRSESVKKIV